MEMKKRCKSCKIEKDFEAFGIKKQMKDSRLNICKVCSSEHRKIRYADPIKRKKQLAHQAEWRKNHPDYQKAYMQRPGKKERRRETNVAWRESNLDHFKDLQKTYRQRPDWKI